MSTSFEVIPVDTLDITFGQVTERSEYYIQSYLRSIGIHKPISLYANICGEGMNQGVVWEATADTPFQWGTDEYAAFSIEGISGAATVNFEQGYYEDTDPDNPDWFFQDMLKSNVTLGNLAEQLQRAKQLNRRWRLERSMGQPCIIALSYGMISASIAELTGGTIWSEDGARAADRLPTHAPHLRRWSLLPDNCLTSELNAWTPS